MVQTYNLNTAILEASRCLMCDDAPCKCGCPAGVDARKFIRKIRFENLEGAVKYLREVNVLAGSCSYICPSQSLCGVGCSCKGLSTPIDIQGLQRFVMTWERENGVITPLRSTGEMGKVAVIGSGPAGLACATELAVRNYSVTIFDCADVAGGMIRRLIPSFRLPNEVVDFEIEFIKMLGVETKLGVRVDNLDELFEQGFNAVFTGSGVWGSRKLGLNGEELPGVWSAIDLLNLAKRGEPIDIGQRVVVVGGGDTALDAAMVLKQMGKDVTVAYRRSFSDMPAYKKEAIEAIEMGVDFIFRTIPRAVMGGKKVEGLRCVRVQWQGAGRATSGYKVEGTEFVLPCDAIITALGQTVTGVFDLRTSPNGYISIDQNMMTSKTGVFAGGDIVTGPKTAVAAVCSGRSAAEGIDKYLSKSSPPL